MCGLLPYGTGICRYAFMQFFVIFDCFCLFKKNLVSINEMECSTIPACPSIVVFLNKGSMEGTNFKNLCFDVCVYMYVFMYVSFALYLCRDCFCGSELRKGLHICRGAGWGVREAGWKHG